MRIWIYLNGVQQGPYTSEEIEAMHLAPSTPVWYEGLSQWMPASEAPLTSTLVESVLQEDVVCERQADDMSAKSEARIYRHSETAADVPPCPSTYMGWAIFATICCCLPGGILAIIFSAQVTGAYNRGDYAKAEKMSDYAQWAIMISIALGVPLSIIGSLF